MSFLSSFNRQIRNLGFDGWFYVFLGVVAVVFSILNATPLSNSITNDWIGRMTLGVLGTLLAAVAFQTTRRKSEINDLREALGLMEVKELKWGTEFPQELEDCVRWVQHQILDTNFNEEIFFKYGDIQKEYRYSLDNQLKKKRHLVFRRVEVFFNKQSLEQVTRDLLTHEGQGYEIRYYDPPPKSIPALHIMRFDDNGFYLGGFNTAQGGILDKVIYIRHPAVNELLSSYWTTLWQGARPLNQGGDINWTEIERVGLRIGMTEEECKEMRTRLSDEAQRSRKGRRK